MLIFIENTPRTYHWGLTEALPKMLGRKATGEPQAELWLGTHPGDPAQVAKATPVPHSLLDLIESDPERYGVAGGPLPFLLKVLAIGGPLSLQVHPNLEQAERGFAREESAGIPRDAAQRTYRDPNHKPELLVALSDVRALAGFRPLPEARREFRALAAQLRGRGADRPAEALEHLVALGSSHDHAAARRELLEWTFSGDPRVSAALAGMRQLAETGVRSVADGDGEALQIPGLSAPRSRAVRELIERYPEDPGVLVSLLLHLVQLDPSEAVYLRPRVPHAYLSGLAVEVMASSDNVLRAGLTQKHVDVAELTRVIDTSDAPVPIFPSEQIAPGLRAWRPLIDDFQLLRARLHDPHREEQAPAGSAPEVELRAAQPVVVIVTEGRVRVERVGGSLAEVATARRGQSLYVSAGDSIRLTGEGEAFLATVGRTHPIQQAQTCPIGIRRTGSRRA